MTDREVRWFNLDFRPAQFYPGKFVQDHSPRNNFPWQYFYASFPPTCNLVSLNTTVRIRVYVFLE